MNTRSDPGPDQPLPDDGAIPPPGDPGRRAVRLHRDSDVRHNPAVGVVAVADVEAPHVAASRRRIRHQPATPRELTTI